MLQVDPGSPKCLHIKMAQINTKVLQSSQDIPNGTAQPRILFLRKGVYITVYTDNNTGDIDVFLTKYSSDGTKKWTKLLVISKYKEAKEIKDNQQQNIILDQEYYSKYLFFVFLLIFVTKIW